MGDMEKLEMERDQLKEEVSKKKALKQEADILKEEVEKLKGEVVNIQKEKEALEHEIDQDRILINEKHVTMRKVASQNGVKSDFDSLERETSLSQEGDSSVFMEEEEETPNIVKGT